MIKSITAAKTKPLKKKAGSDFIIGWHKDFKRNGSLYLIMIPVVIFYFLFSYRPMYGALIAFQEFSPRLGFSGSPWVGFKNFEMFFTSPDFRRIFTNTMTISFSTLIFGFPMPIILALLLNELKTDRFKKIVQTVSYLPHFISMVVICGMIKTFVSSDGIIGMVFKEITGNQSSMLMQADKFLPIYVISEIWQTIGWGSIVYLAALSGIDPQLYEAADIDGAGRFRKMFYITLPSISITIVTMLILRVGKIMDIGYEKIILLYNPVIYDTSDVISSYVYRRGFEGQDWGYSSAVGLFNSFVNLTLIVVTNTISKKLNDTSLW